MSKTNLYAEVLLPLAAPGSFTYSIPESIKDIELVGKRVLVVFGPGQKLYTGIVIDVADKKVSFEVKEILEVLDVTPTITQNGIKLWKWISDYYMCHLGEVMNSALPGILNLSSESKILLNKDFDVIYSELNKKELSVLNSLEGDNVLNIKEISGITGLKNPLSLIRKLIDRKIILMNEEVKNKYQTKKSAWIGLGSNVSSTKNFEEIVLKLKRAPKQLQLLMSLIEMTGWDGESHYEDLIPKTELLNYSNSSGPILKSLVDKDLLKIEMLEESRIDQNESDTSDLLDLNKYQNEALIQIDDLYKEKQVVLLHGVTSSGKTEIYAHLIRRMIDQGKQVLYLLPEISLTSQLINRLKKYFGNQIVVYHSRISQNERAEVWKRVATNDKKDIRVVLGARSSLFLPFNDLGMIIVDEEHDRSFKQQDPAPRYEARDCAVVLAKIHGAKVLLGSATPSLESIENAGSGKYGYVELKKRHGGFELPEMLAVDLNEERRKRKMKGSFSSVLYNEIGDTLYKGEQIILFQNRRGYAPFILCDNCAHTPKCKNCDVSLTYHKKLDYLICHYCGYRERLKKKCPECQVGQLLDIGIGTQRIEEELKELFPDIKLARLDLDSTRKKNAFQNLINDFEAKEIDILVGTQMVTKGLDFENVGLVGIINADNLLRFPDFRSFERTYQMLTQVAGRAGRKKKRGKVIIQTYDAFHPIIQFVLSGKYKELVKSEMKERKLFKYPPYYRILDVRIKHRDRDVLYDASRIFGKTLKNLFGEQLLGPEFPYIERIRNLYSMQLVIKVDKHSSISAVKKKLASSVAEFTSKDNFKSIKIQVDVDPY